MLSSTLLGAALIFGSSVQAHMALSWPPPFRASSNPNASPPDPDITSPLSTSDQFPCKGEHLKFPAGSPGGASAATLNAGNQHNITFSGSADHQGGSCQVSLSYDSGKSFQVIHSWIGGCPVAGQALDFNVPSDAPSGSAIFAWTWFNKVGNREIYMNCASVTIASGSQKRAAPAVAFKQRPDLFVANLNNGCTVDDSKDVVFPNPGPEEDVTRKESSDKPNFSGTCAAVNGIGGGGGGDSSAPVVSVAPGPSAPAASSTAPATLPASSVPSPPAASQPATLSTIITSTSTAVSPPVSTGTGTPAPGNLKPSLDGSCGTASGQTCSNGNCCSAQNFCGSSDAYCGAGCQAAFGQCGSFKNNSGSATSSSLGKLFPVGVAGRLRV